MKTKTFILTFLLSVLTFVGCANPNAALEQELNDLKTKLEKAEKALAEASVPKASSNVDAFPLIHEVYFKIKPDVEPATLIEEINKLEGIEVLHDLEVGIFEDLGDERAMSDFQVVMEMAFANEADYQTYQAHPLHLKLKENVGSMLAGPPVTYDYKRE